MTLASHSGSTTTVRLITFDRGARSQRTDTVAGEEPLQILATGPASEAVDGAATGPLEEPIEVAVTMRTPGHEEELAVGFLFSEGLIELGEVDRVTLADLADSSRPDNSVTVHLTRPLDPAAIAERRTVATASCGICGKASIEDVVRRCDPLPDGSVIDPAMIPVLPTRLREAQEAFESTGGLHASGLFTAAGELTLTREDVGRHNALDKVVGAGYLAGDLPFHDRILVLSGRISFELVQKAAAAGIPIVVAVGAPTDLAVATAERVGMTLVGFVRGERFNVYSRPDRLGLGE